VLYQLSYLARAGKASDEFAPFDRRRT